MRIPILWPLISLATLVATGCAPANNSKDQRTANLKAAATLTTPTPNIATPTSLEGMWGSDCFNSDYSNGMKSLSIGYVFKGNSFFLERDYYANDTCDYTEASIADARASGDVISDVACGWFYLSSVTNGLTNIDMLSATNCGPSEYNVFKLTGTGADAALWLGQGGASQATRRPTTADINYGHWDGSL